ncbi:PHD finger protein ALFIN-LIKE 3-like isoform X2 [Silene latifolia]|uniref:PHD finger protein ALFIN-LIKE 3-like isoform X2 n=1 Tax=Silene latifolia TaxID=37657 RepID=UPI003D777BA1
MNSSDGVIWLFSECSIVTMRRLFNMINDLPTVYEAVTGKAKKQVERSKVSQHSSTKSKSHSNSVKHAKAIQPKEEDEENGDTLCGACGDTYSSNEFWICCDICETWFHGKCVKITPARAEHIKQYKCPSCTLSKKTQP